MQSALIVHSKNTYSYAKEISKEYNTVEFFEVIEQPKEETLKIKTKRDIVIGIGGGSVLDTAKIISGLKRCITYPTTASGASVTPYAVAWGKEKFTIATAKPIVKKYTAPIKLDSYFAQATAYDALSHAVESLWSKKATSESDTYANKAIIFLQKYFKTKDIQVLIEAGNFAGEAIAIASTNIIHATSYPLTINYGINHGVACSMLLPIFLEYYKVTFVYKLFDFSNVVYPKINNFDVDSIVDTVLKNDKINYSKKLLDRESLTIILNRVKEKVE